MQGLNRSLRVGLGLLVGAYATFSGLIGFLNVLLVRLGKSPLYLLKVTDFLGVMVNLPLWKFAFWPIAVVLYAIAAVRLLTGRRALIVYCTGLAFDLAFLVSIKLAGAVHAQPGQLDLDYVTAVITLVIAAAIWATERNEAVGDRQVYSKGLRPL